MKRTAFTLLALLALCLTGCGGSGNETNVAGDLANWSGGESITLDSNTSLAALTGDPDKFVGQILRLEGKVTGVCKGSGCWVKIVDAQGNSFIAKSVDHGIAFPKDCEGKRAVVQGRIISQPVPGHGEKDRHHEHEGEGHECPQPLYMMELAAAQLF